MTIDSLPLLNTATILTLAFATLFRWQSPMQGLLFLIVSTSSSSCFGCWSKLHWNYWTSLEVGINVNSSSPWFPWLSFWGCSRVQHKGVLQKEQICRPALRYLRQTLLVMPFLQSLFSLSAFHHHLTIVIKITFIVIFSASSLAPPPRVFTLSTTIHRRLCSSLIIIIIIIIIIVIMAMMTITIM